MPVTNGYRRWINDSVRETKEPRPTVGLGDEVCVAGGGNRRSDMETLAEPGIPSVFQALSDYYARQMGVQRLADIAVDSDQCIDIQSGGSDGQGERQAVIRTVYERVFDCYVPADYRFYIIGEGAEPEWTLGCSSEVPQPGEVPVRSIWQRRNDFVVGVQLSTGRWLVRPASYPQDEGNSCVRHGRTGRLRIGEDSRGS